MRTTAELRAGFREFFESKGHEFRPSASLIPRADDRSTLLISAGMQPLMPFFIEWAPGSAFPGHRAESSPYRLLELRLAGDPVALRRWLGNDDLPLRVVNGEPTVAGIVLAGPDGQFAL